MTGWRRISVVVFALVAIIAVLIAGQAWMRRHQESAASPLSGLAAFQASTGSLPSDDSGDFTQFPVTIRRPSSLIAVDTGDAETPGSVSCGVCHSMREPNLQNRFVTDLTEFHLGMSFAHGQVTCLSCHNPADYNTLRLADQQSVLFEDVMTLCAQCHGPQARDYEHGAHGGMTGYWDLTRGPRERNGCTDCHDPHAPAFPVMQPTFKPKDRFLSPADQHEAGDHD